MKTTRRALRMSQMNCTIIFDAWMRELKMGTPFTVGLRKALEYAEAEGCALRMKKKP